VVIYEVEGNFMVMHFILLRIFGQLWSS